MLRLTKQQFILAHFLGLSDALKVISAHADQSVKGLVHSASIAANPGVFKKVENAGDMLAWAQGKMGGAPVQTVGLKPIPPGWKGNQEDAIQELGMTADQAAEFLRTGKDTRTGSVVTTAPPPTVNFDATGQTGIPAIDLASGPERMQMLTLARTTMNAREAEARATQNAAHSEWYNTFLNNLQDGKLGQADLNSAYANGQISDYNERMKAQGILDSKNKKDDDLARFHIMLASGQQFNPFDKDAKKAADAGFENAVKYDAEHGSPAGPFQIALREWQRTGILPTAGAVMLRGGLVSSDPNQVGEAAAVASNMIHANPNAFAGAEGQTDIEHAAVAYSHYIYDLGMSPKDAANRIATENDPKFKEKFKYNDPVTIENLNTLRKNGVNATQAFGGGVTFPNQDALNEANQTYYDEIRTELNRGSDINAAMAQAKAQLQKVYGPNALGHIVKYPPERSYPQINGSWDYIYHDAQRTVKQETGRDPIHVNLMPIPGVTDEDFRNGRPARYRVIYSYNVNGQTVVDSVPGQFAADVGQANRAASEAAHQSFTAARKKQIDRGAPVVFPGIGEVR
jgi:hypothetical protein